MAAPFWMGVVAVVAAYLLGTIPTGLVLVRLSTGKDLRREHSGRTGGTNAARAAGAYRRQRGVPQHPPGRGRGDPPGF